MKLFMMILAALSVSVTSLAAQNRTKKELVNALRKSVAVQGAAAEAKKWAGAKSCGPVRIESLGQDGKFFAIVDCHKPNTAAPSEPVGNEASGQAQITGTLLENGQVMIEIIEFAYAG